MMMLLNRTFFLLSSVVALACSFTPSTTSRPLLRSSRTALHASGPQVISEQRRKTLLSRDGPYFNLDRMGGGQIEFGATANLVTQLDTEPAGNDIDTWLRDERGLALSIWDEDLMQEKENDIYRLEVMTLKFVTLELSPWVDMQMKTVTAQSVKDPNRIFPVFRLQSVDFDPNVQLLPGMRVTAESLGIVIHVVGELRATPDGMGVTGKISFATQGKLPPPLLILPEAALKSASDSINKTIVDFAIKSFQRGARAKYEEFRQKQQAALKLEA